MIAIDVFQEFVGLISTITEVLDDFVNDDPYVLASRIADFERNLSFVSNRVNRSLFICDICLTTVS